MKRMTMFLLPIAALLLIGGVVIFKWWKTSVAGVNPTPIPQNEGIVVDDGKTLLKNFGMTDANAVQLQNVSSEAVVGVVNWSPDKKSFTIIANAPEVKGKVLEAWLRFSDGTTERIGVLRKEKAGFLLDYKLKGPIIDQTTVLISRDTAGTVAIGQKLLQGAISVPASTPLLMLSPAPTASSMFAPTGY